ncbi:MAG: type II toxin-antitoxin system RelE/ParE family toxin [Bacteroidales bacterium]
MYTSIILPLAKEDIREAALWYNMQSAGLGKRFTAEVRKKVLFIKQNPKASVVRYDDVRTAVLNIFPFMIHYIIDEANKTIVIISVFHTSREPKIWKKRR